MLLTKCKSKHKIVLDQNPLALDHIYHAEASMFVFHRNLNLFFYIRNYNIAAFQYGEHYCGVIRYVL
jgi:hypothetical protein